MIYTNFDIDELKRKFKCCGKPSFEDELPETVVEGKFIIVDGQLYVGHEGVWVSLGATPLSGTVDTLTYWDSASTLGSVTLGSGLDLTSGTLSVTGGSTGLEALDEGNGFGWRLIGRNPANYGNIGLNAIDFSNSSGASGTRGATGMDAFVWGQNNTASSDASTAWGRGTVSSNTYTTAFGYKTIASGFMSTAWGTYSSSLANSSTAFGLESVANSLASTTIGLFSTIASGQNSNAFIATDEVFKVGNGQSTSARSDALIIYKNAVQKVGGITAANASALTPQAGMIAYVTSTDATFVTTGFWKYQGGAWSPF